jgi:UDP-N-acetylmuramoylalanine--D-glutamate ligase
MASRDYFQGKRVAIVGLGPHGEMVADVKYLIKEGALVSIYDLRSEARLKGHLVFLRSIGLANYVCGSIPSEDLLDMDLIILSPEYSRESQFLKPLADKKIPVEYPETLFFKLAPPVTVVGVMGMVGKSTVMSMLTPLLSKAIKSFNQNFFVIDSESDGGILAHLKKIKSGDMVLVRLLDTIMCELSDMRISPHVAIFTTIPSRKAYHQSPFEILSFQTYNNFIIANDDIIDETHRLNFQTKAKMLRTKGTFLPADWDFKGRGPHDREHAALALQAAQLFKISDDDARNILEKWKGLKGRLEPLKKVKNVEFINDAASVCADSTCTALTCLAENKNIVLIFGGMESGIDYSSLYQTLPLHAHTIVLVPGSGTMKERAVLSKIEGIEVHSSASLENAVEIALERAKKGDRIVFSPGFEAGGLDRSRLERAERFVRAVRGL